MSKKLNQVLAIEKGVKTRVYAELSDLHKLTQKPDLFEGHQKTYVAKDEEGEKYPAQTKRVQVVADTVIGEQVIKMMTELFDVAATKDWANCSAKADVVVDGTSLLTQVPSTYLLFLDKQLGDLNKFVSSFVELDPSVDWSRDPSSGMWKSEAVTTQRTEKKQKPIVLYDATEHHPAQTQLLVEDIVVGHWSTVRFSGAIPATQKQKILERLRKVMHAVKEALEKANEVAATEQKVGAVVLNYLFGASANGSNG